MAGKLPVKVSIVSGNTPLKNVLKLFDAGALVSSVVAHAGLTRTICTPLPSAQCNASCSAYTPRVLSLPQCVRVGTYHGTVDVSTRTYALCTAHDTSTTLTCSRLLCMYVSRTHLDLYADESEAGVPPPVSCFYVSRLPHLPTYFEPRGHPQTERSNPNRLIEDFDSRSPHSNSLCSLSRVLGVSFSVHRFSHLLHVLRLF